ncbi:MAG: NADase-type glycan-binding domain-containing protein [Thermoleophilia bacterium]
MRPRGAAAFLVTTLAAVALGCGPDTPGPGAGLPDADHFKGRPTVQLEVVSTTDSSHLPDVGDITYDAANLVDGALSTAWNVGAGVEPAGQTATLTLAGPSLIEKVEIANGYQKSPDAFRRSGRATFLLLTFSDGTSSSVSLADRDGWQLSDIADVVTETITVKFVDIYEGGDRTLASAAVSEIRFVGKDLPAEP